jgi:phage-related baseplate assembly protein
VPSPDIGNYVDITIFDRQPIDIYQDAVDYAQTALPEFTPVPGSIEDAIIQSMARMTGELVGAINRVPSSVLEALLQLFDIRRDVGRVPVGTVRFETVDDNGYRIPIGTIVGYLDASDPSNPILYTFQTTTDVNIPEGSSSVEVAMIGTTLLRYPPLLADTPLRVLSPLSFVNEAVLVDELNRGEDSESDSDYFARAIARLNSFSSAVVLPDQYQQYVLSAYPDVYRAKAYARTNPENNGWFDSPINGYVTLYVCRAGGGALSSPAMDVIASDVTERSVAGVSISVRTPTIVPVPLSVTVSQKPGYDQAQVILRVEAAIAKYVHPDYWNWSETIFYNEVASLVDQVDGVNRVMSLSFVATEDQSYLDDNDLSFVEKGSLPLAETTVTVA